MAGDAPVLHDDPVHEHARASDILRALADGKDGESVSISQMMHAFGERGFGLLMILFCLPNMVPVPAVGAIFGFPLLLIALQMMMGRDRPWLPRTVEAMRIQRSTLLKMVNAVEPRMRKVEGLLKPRWTFLFSPVMDRVIGLFAALCALSIILPMPGSNFPPAVALILISLAVTQEDGVYLGLGAVIGTAGLIYTTVLIGGLAYASWFALIKLIGV